MKFERNQVFIKTYYYLFFTPNIFEGSIFLILACHKSTNWYVSGLSNDVRPMDTAVFLGTDVKYSYLNCILLSRIRG